MTATTTAQAYNRGNDERADAETWMRPLYRLDFLRLQKYHERLERFRLIRQVIWPRWLKRTGFMDWRHVYDHSQRRQDWTMLSKGMRCCNKWETEAAQLAGQQIVLNGPADRLVWTEVTNERSDRIAIGVHNILNRDTAFHFLHFLHHLDGAYFEQADISYVPWAERADAMQLNPAVFHFVSEHHPQRVEMHYRLSGEDARALNDQVRQAIQLLFHIDPDAERQQ